MENVVRRIVGREDCAKILRYLIENEEIKSTDASKRSGIPRATVSKILTFFVREGVAEETTGRMAKKGRKYRATPKARELAGMLAERYQEIAETLEVSKHA